MDKIRKKYSIRFEFVAEFATRVGTYNEDPSQADLRFLHCQQQLLDLILSDPPALKKMFESRIVDCARYALEDAARSGKLGARSDEEILRPLIQKLDPAAYQLFCEAIEAGAFGESTHELCNCFTYGLESLALTETDEDGK